MSKLFIFKINEGDFDQGFSATFQIWENGKLLEEDTARLAGDPRIPQLYQDWQDIYYRLEPVRQIIFPDDEDDDEPAPNPRELRENCERATKALKAQLKKWFEEKSSQELKTDILDRTGEHDSLRIIFQTENEQLRKLPLHLWDLLKRRKKAEVALSARLQLCSHDNLEDPVKILVILGSSEGIDVETDSNLLNQLPRATVTLLEKPQQQELFEHLYDQRWDILFFGGHSFNGKIKLNDYQSLSLQELEFALEQTIQNGLKLAIFNSCDGLKLARDLEELNIPQVIVMREPVPDLVAQEFLKRFLRLFSEGESLYLAVRKAREYLQGIEGNFPCATWLPIICQNPTAPEISWPLPPTIPPPPPETPLEKLLKLIRKYWREVSAGLGVATAIALLIPPLIKTDTCRERLHQKNDGVSCGEELLIENNTNSDKENGIDAFSKEQFHIAIQHFRHSLQREKNDPETLIYLNNAIAEQNANGKLEIAVTVPISTEPNVAQEILRGVAQAQSKLNCGIENIPHIVNNAPDELICSGGIDGKLLQVTIVDDKDDPETAEQVAHFLVKQNIQATIGHHSSDATQKAGAVYDKKLVMVSPTSTAVKLPDFSDYVFRTAPSNALMAKHLADYMRDELELERAAIAYEPDNAFSESFTKEFQQQLSLKGGQIVHKCALPPGAGGFNAEACIRNAKEGGAEALLLAPGTRNTLDKALRVVQVNNGTLSLLGADSMYHPETLEEFGDNKMVITLPWYYAESGSNPNFLEDSIVLWGTRNVSWRTFMTYDATQAVIKGLQEASCDWYTFLFCRSRNKLQQELSRNDFSAEGATGTVEFEPSGDRKLFTGIGVLVQVQPDPDSETGYKFELLEQPNRE